MKRKPCKSSQLISYGYDAEKKILVVEFKPGSVYHYFEVPPEIYAGLDTAESKGSFLIHKVKKGGFRYEKIVETLEERGANVTTELVEKLNAETEDGSANPKVQ